MPTLTTGPRSSWSATGASRRAGVAGHIPCRSGLHQRATCALGAGCVPGSQMPRDPRQHLRANRLHSAADAVQYPPPWTRRSEVMQFDTEVPSGVPRGQPAHSRASVTAYTLGAGRIAEVALFHSRPPARALPSCHRAALRGRVARPEAIAARPVAAQAVDEAWAVLVAGTLAVRGDSANRRRQPVRSDGSGSNAEQQQ